MKLRIDKRTLRIVLVLAGGLILFLAAAFALRACENASAKDSVPPAPIGGVGDKMVFEGMDYIPRKNLETVLVLGLDKTAKDTSISVQKSEFVQSDFLMLLVLDHAAKTCTPIHLDRDTMVEIDELDKKGRSVGTFTGQLTLAHASGMDFTGSAKGGCRSAASAVSRLLGGVKIDHYLSLTLDAVPALNDLVGGVPVKLLDDFTWLDPGLMKNRNVVLYGDHALAYVRNRTNTRNKTDAGRMERQRQYLTSFRERCAKKVTEDDGFLLETAAALNTYLVSDCTVEELVSLAQAAWDYEVEDYVILPGVSVLGEEFMEFYVDEAALHKMTINIFYEPKEVQ